MSVFSDLKVQNYANRNGFDLGRFSSFSAKAGQILPVFLQPTLPSSDYSLDIKQLLRTQPLQKAAFTGFSINYDVIWCPYNHLYSSFNQFIAQREDKNMVSQPSHQHIPTFDFKGFCKRLFYLGLYDYIMSFCNPNPRKNIIPYSYVFSANSSPSESVVLEVIRMLDMLEYTNLLPLIKNAYITLVNYPWEVSGQPYQIDWSDYDGDNGVHTFFYYFCDNFVPSSVLSPNDVVTAMLYPFNSNQIKINNSRYTPDEFFDSFEYRPNLFAALAYNKMFYEYYRSQYYDDFFTLSTPFFESRTSMIRTKMFRYVQLFNYDDFVDGQNITSCRLSDGELFLRLLAIFYPKHHLYKKDLFTAILPSTQMGDVSMMVTDNDFRKLLGNSVSGGTVPMAPTDNTQVYSSKSTTVGSSELLGQSYSNSYSGVFVKSDKFKFDPALAISVLESRRADAMQRFKERMMRSGHKVKDIFKGQGWESPKSEKSYEPIFLGSFDGRLDINVVAATAETSDINLGQLAGNGMAKVDGHKIKIHTSDFGVLMVLFHVEKDAVYDAYGFNIQHTLVEPFDFPYPVLQNISLAPVAPEYVNLFNLVDTEKKPIGYLPRAIGFKTAVDKVHGEFYSSIPYAIESRGNETVPGLPYVTGAFSDWVAPREDINHPDLLRFLYVQAQCCDMIFVQSANVRQDSDPFLVNARFDCYAVEPLPVIGLPQ